MTTWCLAGPCGKMMMQEPGGEGSSSQVPAKDPAVPQAEVWHGSLFLGTFFGRKIIDRKVGL